MLLYQFHCFVYRYIYLSGAEEKINRFFIYFTFQYSHWNLNRTVEHWLHSSFIFFIYFHFILFYFFIFLLGTVNREKKRKFAEYVRNSLPHNWSFIDEIVDSGRAKLANLDVSRCPANIPGISVWTFDRTLRASTARRGLSGALRSFSDILVHRLESLPPRPSVVRTVPHRGRTYTYSVCAVCVTGLLSSLHCIPHHSSFLFFAFFLHYISVLFLLFVCSSLFSELLVNQIWDFLITKRKWNCYSRILGSN